MRHLGDHLLNVHAHHGIRVDQLLKLGEHGMQHDGLTPSIHPLPVSGKPRLQQVLVLGQPAGPAPHIHTIESSRHKKQTYVWVTK